MGTRRPRGRVLAVAILLALVVGAVVTRLALPELVRRVVVARIHALTDRPTSIEQVELALWSGRLRVRGLRIQERPDARPDGRSPFAEIERLDLRLRVPPLLLGRVRVREATVSGSTVRIVRLPDGQFNLSDLLLRESAGGQPLDLLIERLAVRGGAVVLEDRALARHRTWVSDRIRIDAQQLSTRRGGGSATASSVTAGATTALSLHQLRLYPIHLEGTLTTEGLDAALAGVYLPPRSPVVIPGGRVSSVVTVVLDAQQGLTAEATGRLEDLAMESADGRPLAVVPALTARVRGLRFHQAALRVDGFDADGMMNVRDPAARPGAPLRASRIRARLDDLTWPATTPGRVEIETSIPGGGTLAVAGVLRPPPEPTQLRIRVAGLDVAAWAHLIPTAARVSGLGHADLRIDEPIAAGVPARVRGSVAVTDLGIADARRRRLSAARIEATGLEVAWPQRLDIRRVEIASPRVAVDRDRDGAIAVAELLGTPPNAIPPTPRSRAGGEASSGPSLTVAVGEVAVRGGTLAWRDEAVSPPARLDVASVSGTLTGVSWPLRGPVGLRADLRPPGGGAVHLSARLALHPLRGTIRIAARDADLAPYQPYLATPARLRGAADLDLAVDVPSLSEARATVRGTAELSRVDVRDGERTVLRVERATATGIDAVWPERIDVRRVALVQPWMLAERDARGALTLRPLLTPRRPAATPAVTEPTAVGPAAGPEPPATIASQRPPAAPAIAIAELTVERGGARIVDHAVSPPFAVDLRSATARIDGVSTASARPAHVELTGELGGTGTVQLHGTLRALGPGPLLLDLAGEARRLAVPQANSYIIQHAGWKTTEGWLSSKMQVRVEGDALSSRTDLRVSRLQLMRASAEDTAKTRIGLPLGVITALMKDSHGDIALSIPVSGRLSDPRFEVREALWGAMRTVAVNAIALPVSWIGRVRYSRDSRVEAIEVDPIPFAPGADDLDAEARERLARIAAFLEERSEVRMSLTAELSPRDAAALGRPAIEAALARAAREGRLSRDDAARRLFAHRFPDRTLPATTEAILAALTEATPAATTELADLGQRRVAAVQKALKRAGIAVERLPARPAAQRESRDGLVALEVIEPSTPRPSRTRDFLQRLGVPIRERDPS